MRTAHRTYGLALLAAAAGGLLWTGDAAAGDRRVYYAPGPGHWYAERDRRGPPPRVVYRDGYRSGYGTGYRDGYRDGRWDRHGRWQPAPAWYGRYYAPPRHYRHAGDRWRYADDRWRRGGRDGDVTVVIRVPL